MGWNRHAPCVLTVALLAAVALPTPAVGAALDRVAAGDPTGPALACHGPARATALLAVTARGDLDAVKPRTQRTTLIATGVRTGGGVAVRPELDVAYVTAGGPGGRAAIWSVPLTGCHAGATLVRPDAELPSVSPDGGYLGYVTLDYRGGQNGVAVVRLDRQGRPTGPGRSYPAVSTPPPLPITGLAVGRDDAELAVWGGSVDPYLGRAHPTVGTLDPATARSLRSLIPVFDAEGISVPAPPPGSEDFKPEDWQSSPVFASDGEFLVGDHGTGISMPFTTDNATEMGGGMRTIATDTGRLVSLAAGPSGALAWVAAGGSLVLSPEAIDLPFGPAAETPPRTTADPRYPVPGRFTAVAWTAGASAEANPILPHPAFEGVAHLPSVVGLSTAKATSLMAGLGLPVFVGNSVPRPSVSPGTVLAQNPPAGDGVACQCAVDLTVSEG